MSEKVHELVRRLERLPERVQDEFLAQAKGAEIALEAMKQDEKKSA